MLYNSSGRPFSIGVPVNANLIGMLLEIFFTVLERCDLNP
jgi:hypothetical protein